MSHLGFLTRSPNTPVVEISPHCPVTEYVGWVDGTFSDPSCRAAQPGHWLLALIAPAGHPLFGYEHHNWVIRFIFQRKCKVSVIQRETETICFLHPVTRIIRFSVKITTGWDQTLKRNVQGLWLTTRFQPTRHEPEPTPHTLLIHRIEQELSPFYNY